VEIIGAEILSLTNVISWLEFVFKSGGDLFRLNTKISKGDPLRIMVETLGESGKVNPERDPLMVSPGLPQCVRSEVSLESNSLTPTFDQGIYGIRFKRPTEADKEWFSIRPTKGKQGGNRGDTGAIYDYRTHLLSLPLSQGDGIHRFKIPNLAHGEADKIGCPEVGIDANDKDSIVPGVALE